MPDPYASITEADESIQRRLAEVLELRAADPQQRDMTEQYLSKILLPDGARALEIGCGTGAVSRRIAERFPRIDVVGVDPCRIFLDKARQLAAHLANLSFCEGDGRALSFANESFDLVVFHTSLCHIPEPQDTIREAQRVLRPAGWLAAFEGDYVTTTVATSDFDPLQQAIEATVANFVHDRWLTRRLPKLLCTQGFALTSLRGFNFTQTSEPTYMLTLVDRGAELLFAQGAIGFEAAEAIKAEAKRRVAAEEFFGSISFLSLIVRKPPLPSTPPTT
jgi:ubiquinone/menaquinone biosynthesis C-methylase UbiE